MSQPIRECDLPKMFEGLKQREFFGKVTVEFNRGQARIVRIEETKIIQDGVNHHDCNHNEMQVHETRRR